MRTMQDSDITAGFSAGADIYAAYVLSDTGEGHDNYAATVSRFPDAKHLSICTRFNATAQCLDFEAGTTGVSADDAQQCVQWVQRMRAQGGTPSVYVQLSLWNWLAGVFDAAGVAPPGWWIAHWTGVAHLEPGSDATQWQGGSLVDLNTVADYWPTVDGGLDPSGGGTPEQPPPEEDDMADLIPFVAKVTDPEGNPATFVIPRDFAYKTRLSDPTTADNVWALGDPATPGGRLFIQALGFTWAGLSDTPDSN